MAKNILDALKPRAMSGSKMAQAIRSRSGKAAAASGGPAASNVAERAAAAIGDLGVRDVQEQAATAKEGLTGQREQLQTQATLQQSQQEANRRGMKMSAMMDTNRLLADADRAEKELDTKKYLSEVEQLGFLLGLQDQQYIVNLQMEGNRRRLGDGLSFAESLQADIFGDSEMLVRLGLDAQSLLNMDRRKFDEILSKMDVDFAIEMAQEEASAESSAAMVTAVSSGVAGAGGVWEAKREEDAYQESQKGKK